MKKTAVAIIMLFCLLLAVTPAVKATDTVYFTAVNDTLFPLKGNTMPRYIGGRLYLHYTVFSSDELGIYFAASNNLDTILLYSSGSKRLTFDLPKATVVDQDNQQYFTPAVVSGGTVFLPAEFVCSYFGLALSVIQADPAPVVRIKKNCVLNDPTFPSYYKNKMQSYYNDYMGIKPSPGGDSPSSSPDASDDASNDNITVFLSFSNLSGGKFDAILNALDASRVKGTFFVSADEIAPNADLLRRAACSAHTIGIRLLDGTYAEYQKAAALLFEAAKVKTLLVTGGSDAKAAKAMADSGGLIYWLPDKSYVASSTFTVSSVIGKLSFVKGSRQSVGFDCSEKTSKFLHAFLQALAKKNCAARRITETSAPTFSLN
ncbi:hypothetical protein IZU99_02970 [Oscillospiraceae bacterium CM]|nr:hypothetical protein IZU99_02970 [Oscillospiraceae bacterium CM]